MIFAIYLLICGVATPIWLGLIAYKKLKKGVTPGEKSQEHICTDEQQS